MRVWVFFTDKGLGTRGDLDRALAGARAALSPRARTRRTALGPDLGLDFTDLPVHAAYVRTLRAAGFRVVRTSRWLNAVSLVTEPSRLPALGEFGFVRWVQPVLEKRGEPGPVPLPAAPETPRAGVLGTGAPGDSLEHAFYGPSYDQLDQIHVLALHRAGYSGAGVRVMMLDTGFRKDHPVFAHSPIVAEWDFVNEDGNTQNEGSDVASQQSHGTGTWAVLGGYAPGALIGPAFGAEFVLAKTEDVTQEVHAEEDNYVAALEWGDSLGVDVTSASLAYFTFDSGGSYTIADLDGDTAVITMAVDLAVAKGISCVNAAGNEGPGTTTIWTPADADSVIAVGAVDASGAVAGFSSRGPTADNRIKPDISARGVYTWWAQASSLDYGQANGTSLATPLIGGLAALLKEAHPGWTGERIREAILATGSQATSPDNNLGYGLARADSAAADGGEPLAPPRMTLPFRLVAPEHEATVGVLQPTLVWCASATPAGGEVDYRVVWSPDSAFAAAETVAVGPDTTYTFGLAVASGTTVWWKVRATAPLGYVRESEDVRNFLVGAQVGVRPGDGPSPRVMLGPAYPNPARGATRFSVQVPSGERARLDVLDVAGRLVRRLELAGQGREESVFWDGRDDAGRAVPAGVYLYRLSAGSASWTRKLVRLP